MTPGSVVRRNRGDECAHLDGLLKGALAGRSGVLILRGEAGVGKTTLLEYAIASASASALRVVRVAGMESEMELPFAGLHQLCAPMLDRLERVPAPQREALQTTFGLSAGAVPDRFLVGLAVLSLLSEAAQERPILCVIDDAQWLDRASAQALGFVARRMLAEPVALLFAAREPSDPLTGLPELALEGLADADARALLASVVPGPLDPRIAEQIIVEARGNPLALSELPRGRSAGQLAGGFGLPGALSLSGRIEQSFLGRLEAPQEDTRRFLLVAAAEPTGDPALLWRAAERLALHPAALQPAESAGLIDVMGRVRFRHPLVRSAVYRAATQQERRSVHRALAEATDARIDPDRRAWHLAEGTTGPDEEVAAELERAADRAQSRGGLAAAAAFLERAVALTPDAARRGERVLAAAQANLDAGSAGAASGLLDAADMRLLDELGRARLERMRARIAFVTRRGRDVPPLLLSAARRLESVDVQLARDTYLEALEAATFAGSLGSGRGLLEVAEAARAAPPAPDAPRPSDLFLDGLTARYSDGYAAGVPTLKRALGAYRHSDDLRWLGLAVHTAWELWDHEAWHTLATREVQLARETGALSLLPLALTFLAGATVLTGDFAAAAALIEEARSITIATGSPRISYAEVYLAAWRGHEQEHAALVEEMLEDAKARGEGRAITLIEVSTAILHDGLGEHRTALAAAQRACETGDADPWALPELVEAAARSDLPELARTSLERLSELAQCSGTDLALGQRALHLALLAEGRVTEDLFHEALDRLSRTRTAALLARAHLLYGEWLRRERRRRDAREQLRTAHEMFVSMGAEAYARRAARELLATGEHARKRSVETRDDLTAQEAQIARLARDGLSNAEIGVRLFVSQTTVAYHLRNVFSKLNIGSRHQLAAVLPDS
jgi:DNA-binding CsgD family transcriptional regulator